MLTSVLVPCWNALDLTQVCLEAISRATTRPYELVLVDNGSTDGTWAWLKKWSAGKPRPKALRRVVLLRNRKNRGYPGGMNQAAAAARGELLVFANADAAPGPFWLEEMAALFSSRPKLGGLAPCTTRMDGRPPRRPWAAPPWYEDLDGMRRLAAAWAMKPSPAFVECPGFVPGFWFMTPRKVLDRVGLFDERFFPGTFEDVDLQYRMRRAGYELGWAERAYVHHAWFAVSRRNGLRKSVLGPPRKKLLYEKHPDAHGLYMEARSPAWQRG